MLGQKAVEVAGRGVLAGQELSLPLEVIVDDPGAWLELVTGRDDLAVEGRAAGRLALRHSGASGTTVELSLTELNLRYSGLELDNLEPVVARLEPDAVVLDSFFVGHGSDGSELFLGGRIGLDGGDLTAEYVLNVFGDHLGIGALTELDQSGDVAVVAKQRCGDDQDADEQRNRNGSPFGCVCG